MATHIGRNFERITFAINNANQILKTKTEEDMLRQEAEDGCGAHCVSQKMNQVIRQTGVATKNSILKLGFSKLNLYLTTLGPLMWPFRLHTYSLMMETLRRSFKVHTG